MNELIFKAINDSTNASGTQKVIFEPNDKIPIVYIDGGFLEMILYNLIHNALQHTPTKSNIIIQCDYRNEKLIIDISDNGTGFPKGEINLVFDKFYKLNGTATGGTGMGLSIVKGFTETLDGKIYIWKTKKQVAPIFIWKSLPKLQL